MGIEGEISFLEAQNAIASASYKSALSLHQNLLGRVDDLKFVWPKHQEVTVTKSSGFIPVEIAGRTVWAISEGENNGGRYKFGLNSQVSYRVHNGKTTTEGLPSGVKVYGR